MTPAAQSNGWNLYFYPLFQERFDELRARAIQLENTLTDEQIARHPDVKLFEALVQIVQELVPSNPDHKSFRLGGSLGDIGSNWRRFKGNPLPSRYRLFFRFSSRARVIVFCWLSDAEALRKAGAATDPYAVFAAMLKRKKPPADFDELMHALSIHRPGSNRAPLPQARD